MASVLINKFLLFLLPFFTCLFVSFTSQNLLSCDTTSLDAYGYLCAKNTQKCTTFAVLKTNSYYSSLSNLTIYLGLDRFKVAGANGFSPDTEILPRNQPLLVPIECKCSNGGVFQAEITKVTNQGESFYSIAESLQGLTTCRAIKERNPSVLPSNPGFQIRLSVPLRCACPTPEEIFSGLKLLLSYSVSRGDSVNSLSSEFNTTLAAIVSVNSKRSVGKFRPEFFDLGPSILIPVTQKPLLGSLAKPREPSFGFPSTHIRPEISCKKRSKMQWKFAVCIVVVSVAVGASIVLLGTFLAIQWKRTKQQSSLKLGADTELQQLSLSVRTTSEKKVSFEGSQSTLDNQMMDATPHKMMLESYTLDELKKATEDFNSANLIEGSVYHGRHKGKNMAIKCTTREFISKLEFELFQDALHNHPNIIRVLGLCKLDDSNAFLVLEYAKNGSLKDWLHGGLAMKSHFIASCYCFLTWAQRLRICLDVALALQYMHHIMHPTNVHRNIKSNNIFLDEEFNAKVGNFGKSKCIEDDPNEIKFSPSNPSSWNKGYLAPEYIKQGTISPAMDIFAYGVVLMEVLSGKTPLTCSDEKEQEGYQLLYEESKSMLQSENTEELREWMDGALGDEYSFNVAVTLANLARACTEEDPCLRPGAGEIVEKLSGLVEESPEEKGEQYLVNESSSKPLVQAAASTNNV